MRARTPGGMSLLVALASLLALVLATMQVALGRDWHRPTVTGACEIGCFPGGLDGVAAAWALGTVLVAGLGVWAFLTRSAGHGWLLVLAAVLLLVSVPLDPFPVLGRWVVLSSARSEPTARLVVAGACCVVAAVLLAVESIRLVSPAAPRTARRRPRPASPRRSPAASPHRR